MKANAKLATTLTIIGTAVLLVVLSASIMMAAFTASKNATTQITFADGVDFSIGGVSTNTWSLSTTTGYGGTIRPELSKFNAITAQCTSGPSSTINAYLRVFAIVWSDSPTTIQNLTIGSDASITDKVTGSTNTANANLTTQENAVLTNLRNSSITNVSYVAMTRQFTLSDKTNSNVITMINQYTPFDGTIPVENLTDKFVKGLVVISAANTTQTLSTWDTVNGYTFTNLMPQ